jgi:flagellar basal-body rod protein FlgB
MEPVYLFNLIDQQKSWLSARQALVAQNVANVNTPGYKAQDVLPFARVMERTVSFVCLRSVFTRARTLTWKFGRRR